MNKVSGIYKITNPVGNIYIGQSKDSKLKMSSSRKEYLKRKNNLLE